MKKRVSRSLAVALTALVVGGATGLVAQDEEEQQCQLAPSDAVSRAAEALEDASELQEPAEREAKYREAVEALRSPVEDETDDPAPYVFSARAHASLGHFEVADSLLHVFVEKAPECATAARNARYNIWVEAFNAAIQSYQAGDEEAALVHFENANLIYQDARALNNAAILHRQRGDDERAMGLYRTALQTEGEAEHIRTAAIELAELLSMRGEAEEAVAVFDDYLAEHPDDVVARINYALALSEAGDPEAAAGIFGEVLGRDDLSYEQWVQVGVGLFRAEDYEQAAQAFASAREENPYNKEAMENLVSSAVQAGNPGSVVSLGDTLVSWYPYDTGNYSLLASALARQQNQERALQVLQEGENTPIAFESIQLGGSGPTYLVRGVMSAREAGAGQTFEIPFEFLGATGEVVATETLSLQAPAAGETASFQLRVESSEPILGFRYGKAGSR